MTRPNHWVCHECPKWDSVNGCWKDILDVADCYFIDEDGNWSEARYDEFQTELLGKYEDSG